MLSTLHNVRPRTPNPIGQAAYAILTPTTLNNAVTVGWGDTTNGDLAFILNTNLSIDIRVGSTIVATNTGTFALNTQYEFLVVRRSAGAFFYIRGGAFTAWTLLWVNRSMTTLPGNIRYLSTSNTITAELRPVDIAFVFPSLGSDFGIANSRSTNPASGTTFTHATALLVEWSFTFNATGFTGVHVRRTDSSNEWRMYTNSAGTLTLEERNAGVQNIRGSSTSAFVNGTTYSVMAVINGNLYRIFVNGAQRITYTDAGSFNAAVTNGIVSATGGGAALTEVAAWPRTAAIPAF